jgi:hypothetical protein
MKWLRELIESFRPCRHEFTYWTLRETWKGPGKQWYHICTKCGAAELIHSETDPNDK